MPSINLDLDYFTHPKTKRLVRLLGRGAEVIPIKIWCFCGRHHPETGILTETSGQEIEAMVGWWGRPGEAVAAMLEIGLLELVPSPGVPPIQGQAKDDDKSFKVHDWLEWSGHLKRYKELGKKGAKARWTKRKEGKDDACGNACGNASSNALLCNVSSENLQNGASPNVQCAPSFYPGRGYFMSLEPAAKRVITEYQKATETAHDSRGGAEAVVKLLGMKEATEADLIAAIRHWSEHAKKTYADRRLRLSAKNFFGGEAPAWQNWVNGSPVVSGERRMRTTAEVKEEHRKEMKKLGLE